MHIGSPALIAVDSSMLKIYLFRHGQTDWNKLYRLQGHSDIPLNEEGRQQASLLATQLPLEEIEKVYASDLARAIETAQLATQNQIHLEQDPRLREAFLGDIEGQDRHQIPTLIGEERWNQWLSYDPNNWNTQLPGPSESKNQVLARALEFLHELRQRPERTVAVCSHGVLIRTLLVHLGKDNSQPIGNCEWQLLEFPTDSPCLNL